MAGKYRLISHNIRAKLWMLTISSLISSARLSSHWVSPWGTLICHKCNGFIDGVIIVFCGERHHQPSQSSPDYHFFLLQISPTTFLPDWSSHFDFYLRKQMFCTKINVTTLCECCVDLHLIDASSLERNCVKSPLFSVFRLL